MTSHAGSPPSFDLAGADPARLSPEAVAAYRRDGVVCLRGALDAHWLDRAAKGIARSLASPGPMFIDYTSAGAVGAYANDFWVWQRIPEFRELIFDSPMAAIAGQLMGAAETVLFTDNWMIRRAGAADRAPWHHDLPYFDADGEMCVLWVPLEPVEPGGGVDVVRGSHRWDKIFMPVHFGSHEPKAPPGGAYAVMPDLEAERDRHEFLSWTLAPGDCLAFTGLTVHGAAGGASAAAAARTIRRLTMRFVAGDATYRRRGAWTKATADVLEAQGLRDGDPLACELLPVLWRR